MTYCPTIQSCNCLYCGQVNYVWGNATDTCLKVVQNKRTHSFFYLSHQFVAPSGRLMEWWWDYGRYFSTAHKKNNLAAADKQNDWEAVLCVRVVFSGLYKLLRILYSDVFALFVSLSPSAVAAGRRFPARLRGRASLQWESWRRGSSRLWPERSVEKRSERER